MMKRLQAKGSWALVPSFGRTRGNRLAVGLLLLSGLLAGCGEKPAAPAGANMEAEKTATSTPAVTPATAADAGIRMVVS